MVVGGLGVGGRLESRMNPDRPVAPEQVGAFLRDQFFRLSAGVHAPAPSRYDAEPWRTSIKEHAGVFNWT